MNPFSDNMSISMATGRSVVSLAAYNANIEQEFSRVAGNLDDPSGGALSKSSEQKFWESVYKSASERPDNGPVYVKTQGALTPRMLDGACRMEGVFGAVSPGGNAFIIRQEDMEKVAGVAEKLSDGRISLEDLHAFMEGDEKTPFGEEAPEEEAAEEAAEEAKKSQATVINIPGGGGGSAHKTHAEEAKPEEQKVTSVLSGEEGSLGVLSSDQGILAKEEGTEKKKAPSAPQKKETKAGPGIGTDAANRQALRGKGIDRSELAGAAGVAVGAAKKAAKAAGKAVKAGEEIEGLGEEIAGKAAEEGIGAAVSGVKETASSAAEGGAPVSSQPSAGSAFPADSLKKTPENKTDIEGETIPVPGRQESGAGSGIHGVAEEHVRAGKAGTEKEGSRADIFGTGSAGSSGTGDLSSESAIQDVVSAGAGAAEKGSQNRKSPAPQEKNSGQETASGKIGNTAYVKNEAGKNAAGKKEDAAEPDYTVHRNGGQGQKTAKKAESALEEPEVPAEAGTESGFKPAADENAETASGSSGGTREGYGKAVLKESAASDTAEAPVSGKTAAREEPTQGTDGFKQLSEAKNFASQSVPQQYAGSAFNEGQTTESQSAADNAGTKTSPESEGFAASKKQTAEADRAASRRQDAEAAGAGHLSDGSIFGAGAAGTGKAAGPGEPGSILQEDSGKSGGNTKEPVGSAAGSSRGADKATGSVPGTVTAQSDEGGPSYVVRRGAKQDKKPAAKSPQEENTEAEVPFPEAENPSDENVSAAGSGSVNAANKETVSAAGRNTNLIGTGENDKETQNTDAAETPEGIKPQSFSREQTAGSAFEAGKEPEKENASDSKTASAEEQTADASAAKPGVAVKTESAQPVTNAVGSGTSSAAGGIDSILAGSAGAVFAGAAQKTAEAKETGAAGISGKPEGPSSGKTGGRLKKRDAAPEEEPGYKVNRKVPEKKAKTAGQAEPEEVQESEVSSAAVQQAESGSAQDTGQAQNAGIPGAAPAEEVQAAASSKETLTADASGVAAVAAQNQSAGTAFPEANENTQAAPETVGSENIQAAVNEVSGGESVQTAAKGTSGSGVLNAAGMSGLGSAAGTILAGGEKGVFAEEGNGPKTVSANQVPEGAEKAPANALKEHLTGIRKETAEEGDYRAFKKPAEKKPVFKTTETEELLPEEETQAAKENQASDVSGTVVEPAQGQGTGSAFPETDKSGTQIASEIQAAKTGDGGSIQQTVQGTTGGSPGSSAVQSAQGSESGILNAAGMSGLGSAAGTILAGGEKGVFAEESRKPESAPAGQTQEAPGKAPVNALKGHSSGIRKDTAEEGNYGAAGKPAEKKKTPVKTGAEEALPGEETQSTPGSAVSKTAQPAAGEATRAETAAGGTVPSAFEAEPAGAASGTSKTASASAAGQESPSYAQSRTIASGSSSIARPASSMFGYGSAIGSGTAFFLAGSESVSVSAGEKGGASGGESSKLQAGTSAKEGIFGSYHSVGRPDSSVFAGSEKGSISASAYRRTGSAKGKTGGAEQTVSPEGAAGISAGGMQTGIPGEQSAAAGSFSSSYHQLHARAVEKPGTGSGILQAGAGIYSSLADEAMGDDDEQVQSVKKGAGSGAKAAKNAFRFDSLQYAEGGAAAGAAASFAGGSAAGSVFKQSYDEFNNYFKTTYNGQGLAFSKNDDRAVQKTGSALQSELVKKGALKWEGEQYVKTKGYNQAVSEMGLSQRAQGLMEDMLGISGVNSWLQKSGFGQVSPFNAKQTRQTAENFVRGAVSAGAMRKTGGRYVKTSAYSEWIGKSGLSQSEQGTLDNLISSVNKSCRSRTNAGQILAGRASSFGKSVADYDETRTLAAAGETFGGVTKGAKSILQLSSQMQMFKAGTDSIMFSSGGKTGSKDHPIVSSAYQSLKDAAEGKNLNGGKENENNAASAVVETIKKHVDKVKNFASGGAAAGSTPKIKPTESGIPKTEKPVIKTQSSEEDGGWLSTSSSAQTAAASAASAAVKAVTKLIKIIAGAAAASIPFLLVVLIIILVIALVSTLLAAITSIFGFSLTGMEESDAWLSTAWTGIQTILGQVATFLGNVASAISSAIEWWAKLFSGG